MWRFVGTSRALRPGVLIGRDRRLTVKRRGDAGWAQPVPLVGGPMAGMPVPIKDLMEKFGFSPEKVLAAAKGQLARASEAKETAK